MGNSEWLTFAGVVVAALLAALPGILSLRRQSKKDDIDGASTLAGAATKLIEPLQERLDALEKEIARQAVEINNLRRKVGLQKMAIDRLMEGISRLSFQVRSLGGVPVFDETNVAEVQALLEEKPGSANVPKEKK